MRRFSLHRKRELGEIKAELRTIMNDYGIYEAYLSTLDDPNIDSIRPKYVRLYYFVPMEDPDFDDHQFEQTLRDRFNGQVLSQILFEDHPSLKMLRKKNAALF